MNFDFLADFIYENVSYWILTIASFISATIIPFGSEALLIYMNEHNFKYEYLLFFATLGNTLGSCVNYYFGIKGIEQISSHKLYSKEKIQKYENFFQKYGTFALFLSWAPMVGDIFTVLAGAFKYNFIKFTIIVAIAKAIRYMAVLGIFDFFI